MGEPLDADRLIYGGSLYPPPDVPIRLSRRVSLLLIALAAVAAWGVVCLMVSSVLL